jgi:ABC-type Fe3+-hydroxamate transport system, periplasmic component
VQKLLTLCIVALVLISAVAVAPAAAEEHDATYQECEFPVTVEDATGEEITLEEPPDRVTTTSPSAAQIMWELDAQDQVVGVTRFATYLDGASERTDVSAQFGVNIEKVANTTPDLVLAPNTSAGNVEGLRSANLTVYHYAAATEIDDIRDQTRVTGQLTGNCEAAAETNAWMDANVDAISEVTAEADKQPDVMYSLGGQEGQDPFIVGGNTFVTSMLEAAGANNVAADEGTGYPQLSAEVILELDPEFLIVTEGGESIVESEPYASTTAGQEGNTITLQVNYLSQPAPRSVVFTTHNATEQLHPEVYSPDTYVPRSDITVISESEAEAQQETATPTPSEAQQETPTETADSVPGFGAIAALVAMLAAALVATRRR